MSGKSVCAGVVALMVISAAGFGATYPGQMGVNIGGVGEGGGIFVDMAKEHHRYSRLPSGTMAYDSEGWPSCDAQLVMDFRLVAEWIGEIDDPEEYRYDNTGTYKCSFVGQATLSASGASIANKSYDSGTNTTTFDLIITQKRAYCHLDFTNTKRTAVSSTDTGFTDLKMIKPGYAGDTMQTFTDDFINTLTSASFGVVRYMNVTATNGHEATYPATLSWSDRKLVTDAAQVPIDAIGKPQGAAWEYVIQIANMTGMDPWINVPVSATTDYVTQLATMFRDNLDPNLHVYVENSNEVWNGIFYQQIWSAAQAGALGIDEHENYARQTVELAQIFESVFGTGSLNNRVRVMLCCHAPMLKWWVETYMIPYINSNFPGTASDYIYAIARQTYFSAGDPSPDTRTIDQLLDACVTDIDGQMSETGGGEAGRLQWVQKAATWGLVGGACSYEGGYHSPANGVLENLDNKIMMHRVPRGGEVLKYNYDDAFFALGANIAIQFTLQSSATRYGFWGLTDDLANPDRNYKFQAMRELLGDETLLADFDNSGVVDIMDFNVMATDWMLQDGFTGSQDPGYVGLVAWWPLDASSGDVAVDDSGNARDGMLGSAVGADVNDPTWFNDAERGWCLYFDGGDYIQCGGGKNAGADPCDPETWTDPCTWADFASSSFTISVWINQNNSPDWGVFVGKGEIQYKLQFLLFLDLLHFAFPRTPGGLGGSAMILNNQWYHVAGLWDEDNESAYLYLDGVLDNWMDYGTAHPEGAGVFIDNDCNVLIGATVSEGYLEDPNRHKIGGCPLRGDAAGYAERFFNGYLSEVRMYERALNELEIKYLAGIPSTYTPLDSVANIYDEEAEGLKAVNFRDFALLANEWMVTGP